MGFERPPANGSLCLVLVVLFKVLTSKLDLPIPTIAIKSLFSPLDGQDMVAVECVIVFRNTSKRVQEYRARRWEYMNTLQR